MWKYIYIPTPIDYFKSCAEGGNMIPVSIIEMGTQVIPLIPFAQGENLSHGCIELGFLSFVVPHIRGNSTIFAAAVRELPHQTYGCIIWR